ncbi:MAG TPA: GNAT family N-acetyltransferase [Gaiellaceae bacterium]
MELASERLVLRPAHLGDLDFYVELRNHPEILAPQRGDPCPRSEVERRLRSWIEQWQEQGFGAWTVFARGSSERLGRVEFDPVPPGWSEIAPDEIEVGCIVHPAYWNRGIATEATQMAAEDFFGRVGRRRLVALATADNPASLRTLEKLGMRYCGETHGEGDATPYLLFELVKP